MQENCPRNQWLYKKYKGMKPKQSRTMRFNAIQNQGKKTEKEILFYLPVHNFLMVFVIGAHSPTCDSISS